MTRSEPWCKLRHYLGRWLSYRKAARGIVAVSERWPKLVLDFEITMVPSGSRLPKPKLLPGLTSSTIIEQITSKDKSLVLDLNEVTYILEKMGIDETIQKSVKSSHFRPRLHAEVLVYEYLARNEKAAAESYWNLWSYIGSSKPTCRLCHYYFEALEDDKPTVRSSHHNLYRDWRLPEHHDADTRDQILDSIVRRLRADVMKTLREKKLTGKDRDSNTYSSFPAGLRIHDHTSWSTDTEDWEPADSTDTENGSTGKSEDVTSPMD